MKAITRGKLIIRLLPCIIIISISLLVYCGPSECDLTGQTFIVTKGRENIKLGLVEIKVFRERVITDQVLQKKMDLKEVGSRYQQSHEELIALIKAYQDLEERMKTDSSITDNERLEAENRRTAKAKEASPLAEEYYRSRNMSFWVEGLPNPFKTTKSDADGRFNLRLKPGRYAIVAESSRMVTDENEEYFWFIWVEVKKNREPLFLSNDNLFEMFCPECVIRSADIFR
jgi:hypothetical protein